MIHVRLFTVVLCCLIVVSGQVVHAQEGAPPADVEAPPITCEGGYAPVFRLGGRVQFPKNFDLDALSQEPLTTVHDFFRKAVLITGSDCYETVYAMGELAPQLGGTHQVIVAFKRDEEILGTTEGMARIINPGDKDGARRLLIMGRIRVLACHPPGGQPNLAA